MTTMRATVTDHTTFVLNPFYSSKILCDLTIVREDSPKHWPN